MMWRSLGSLVDIVAWATPWCTASLTGGWARPSIVKTTLPLGVPPPVGETVAVRVITWPTTGRFGETASLVVVPVGVGVGVGVGVLIRACPILFAAVSVKARVPLGPAAMPVGPLAAVGVGTSVMPRFAGLNCPILLAAVSVKYRLPSDPV